MLVCVVVIASKGLGWGMSAFLLVWGRVLDGGGQEKEEPAEGDEKDWLFMWVGIAISMVRLFFRRIRKLALSFSLSAKTIAQVFQY